MLPDAAFLTEGQFVRTGGDLVLSGTDGHQVIVRGYFSADAAPDLVTPDGSQVLTPNLVESFLMPLAPGQYAQAAPLAVASPIGQVLDLNGDAFAVHADGTRVQLAKGDPVYEGDIVETAGAGSAIRMVFTDKTEFSLGTDARLALDQLVFNPDTQSGSAQFSILKGVFIFASGQIAKTDNTDMTVITPVATIGIRGTEVAGRVTASDSQFTVVDGAIEVTTRAGSVTLDQRGETTEVAGIDTAPSAPMVLTPAQFGQAYGDVAGVASNYFGAGQVPQAPVPGGDGTPAAPDGSQPDAAPDAPGDRTDAGTVPAETMLATTLPTESLNPAPLTATFGAGTAATAAGAIDLASGLAAVAGTTVGAAASPLPGAGLLGLTPSAAPAGGGVPPIAESVVTAVPGLDLAASLTFSATAMAANDPSGFSLVPAMAGDMPGNGPGALPGSVQVAFAPGGAGGLPAADGAGDVGPGTGSPPLDMPSTGSSGSPFRSESGAAGSTGGNPYIAHPFGYSGPQLGDPIFALVSGGNNAPAAAASGASTGDDPDPILGTPAAQISGGGSDAAPVPDPANITLTVSNATISEAYQDLARRFELPITDLAPGAHMTILGSDIRVAVPNVPVSAAISVDRDIDGSLDVALTSAWDSVKNIKAENDTAADITIDNFVHADVTFGDGGDSHVTIHDAKRGFVVTGNGNDQVEIGAYSNGPGWSHHFDVRTGAGDDILVFSGATNGLSQITFDGGDGIDTLRLSGAGQSFSLLSGRVQVSDVERIDISGAGNTTLTVSSTLFGPLDTTVNGLTGTAQTLVVDGDAGDTLDLQGSGWNQASTTQIDGSSYTVYEHASGMHVAVDSDMQVA